MIVASCYVSRLIVSQICALYWPDDVSLSLFIYGDG